MRRLRIRRFAAIAVLGVVGSFIFMRFLRADPEFDDGDALTALMVSVLLASTFVLFESRIVPATRRLALLPATLIRTATYSLGALGSVFVGILVANVLQDGWEAAKVRIAGLIAEGEIWSGCIFGLVIMLAAVFVSCIAQKLGPGILGNWVLGRYHQPREERCVFLFLDLRGSTGLTERLGDKRFSALIQDVFADMTPALLEYGARISHFIGDGVVLYWPVGKAARPDAAFARTFFAVRALFEHLAPEYVQKYGSAPKFKAGAAWGTVIATDVGQIKSEIVFHGDVLNVASRLESLCNEEGASLLVPADLAEVLQGGEFALEDRGLRTLRGKGQTIGVVAVDKA